MRVRKSGPGYTAVELLVVVAIFVLLLSATGPIYRRVQDKQQSEADAASIVHALRRAQQLAATASRDSGWGVRIAVGQATIFPGASYAGRDPAYDETIKYYSVSGVSGISEFVFSKLTGNPVSTGTTTLVTRWGAENISVNAKGMVDY